MEFTLIRFGCTGRILFLARCFLKNIVIVRIVIKLGKIEQGDIFRQVFIQIKAILPNTHDGQERAIPAQIGGIVKLIQVGGRVDGHVVSHSIR